MMPNRDGDGDDPPRGPVAVGPVEPPATAGPVLHYGGRGPDADDRWVRVWTAADTFEANLIVGKLQGHGLHARVDMENAAALGAVAGTGPGGAAVQALAGDAAAARRLLEAVDRDRARRRDAAAVRCSRCGHVPAARLLHPCRKAAAAALLALPVLAGVSPAVGLPPGVYTAAFACLAAVGIVCLVVPVTPRWRCRPCRHAWAGSEPVAPGVDDEDEDEPDGDRRPANSET